MKKKTRVRIIGTEGLTPIKVTSKIRIIDKVPLIDTDRIAKELVVQPPGDSTMCVSFALYNAILAQKLSKSIESDLPFTPDSLHKIVQGDEKVKTSGMLTDRGVYHLFTYAGELLEQSGTGIFVNGIPERSIESFVDNVARGDTGVIFDQSRNHEIAIIGFENDRVVTFDSLGSRIVKTKREDFIKRGMPAAGMGHRLISTTRFEMDEGMPRKIG